MHGFNVCKSYKPKHTCWYHDTVRNAVTRHKRATRRAFKQFLKTGSMRDFNRSQRVINRLDFD